MKPITTFVAMVLVFSFNTGANDWNGDIVYFITGGPLPPQTDGINRSATEFVKTIGTSHPYAFIKVQHNNEWKRICENIQSLRDSKPMGRTVLTGHSYGAQASVDVANCLDDVEIHVDLLVTLDTVQKPFFSNPEIIPENVLTNFNYYQTEDVLLRGLKNNIREDGSSNGISNLEVLPPFIETPHFGMVSKLMFETHKVQGHILDVLRDADRPL